MTSRKRPAVMIRKARNPIAPGWIVHDLRPQNEVKTPAWRRTATRRWRRYSTHTEAVRAACRAIKNHTPLPASTTDYVLAR